MTPLEILGETGTENIDKKCLINTNSGNAIVEYKLDAVSDISSLIINAPSSAIYTVSVIDSISLSAQICIS